MISTFQMQCPAILPLFLLFMIQLHIKKKSILPEIVFSHDPEPERSPNAERDNSNSIS